MDRNALVETPRILPDSFMQLYRSSGRGIENMLPVAVLWENGKTVLRTNHREYCFTKLEDLLAFIVEMGTLIICSNPGQHDLDSFLLLSPNHPELRRAVLNNETVKFGDYIIDFKGRKRLIVRRGNKWGRIFNVQPIINNHEPEEAARIMQQLLTNIKEQIGVDICSLVSPATIAQQILMFSCPDAFPRPMEMEQKILEISLACLKGGRMEAFQIGMVKDCYSWDINAAYLSMLSELPNSKPTFMDWIEDNHFHPEATYGFAFVHTVIPDIGNVAPVGVRSSITGKLYFPAGEVYAFFTKDDIETLLNIGARIEILDAWWGIPKVVSYPFSVIVEMMLKCDPILKQIGVTGIGKFGSVYEQKTGYMVASSLFNPVYLATIISRVRRKVFEKAGATPIAITVDGIITKEEMNLSSKAGEFRLDGRGEVCIFNDYFKDRPGKERWRKCVMSGDLSKNYFEFSYPHRFGLLSERFGESHIVKTRIPIGSLKRRSPCVTVGGLLSESFQTFTPTVEEVMELDSLPDLAIVEESIW